MYRPFSCHYIESKSIDLVSPGPQKCRETGGLWRSQMRQPTSKSPSEHKSGEGMCLYPKTLWQLILYDCSRLEYYSALPYAIWPYLIGGSRPPRPAFEDLPRTSIQQNLWSESDRAGLMLFGNELNSCRISESRKNLPEHVSHVVRRLSRCTACVSHPNIGSPLFINPPCTMSNP